MTTGTFVTKFTERVQKLYEKEILPRYFKAPIFGLWELTSRCNLSCVHCYYNANSSTALTIGTERSRSANSSKSRELSTQEAVNVAKELGELRVFEVYLSGGEPLLRDDWEAIISCLRKEKIQVGIISNGTQIDKKVARTLSGLKVKWVQLSIDGATAKLHDHVRGLEGSWEKSIAAIQYLKSEGVRTHVSFVPSSINYFDVERVIDLCVSMGIEYFVTDMLVLTGRAAINFSRVTLNQEQYTEFFAMLEASAKKHQDKITIIAPSPEKEALKTYLTVRSATPNLWCIITPEGRMRLDLLLPFTYGDLRKHSIRHIWWDFLKEGWQRPEVKSFMAKYEDMSDLVKEDKIPYVTSDIHYE